MQGKWVKRESDGNRFYVTVGINIQEAPSTYESLCIKCMICPQIFSADSTETYPQHAQSLDGTVGSSIPLYRSSEEEKRVTVIKAPHYPGIGPVDESGIPTAIRTVGNASVVAAGLCPGSTKAGLSTALCIPMVLYNEDCPLCHLSSREYYVVCGRERGKELWIEANHRICVCILIENHEDCEFC